MCDCENVSEEAIERCLWGLLPRAIRQDKSMKREREWFMWNSLNNLAWGLCQLSISKKDSKFWKCTVQMHCRNGAEENPLKIGYGKVEKLKVWAVNNTLSQYTLGQLDNNLFQILSVACSIAN